MSEETKPPFDNMEAFTKMWTDFAARMTQAGMATPPGATPSENARRMRDVFLKAMTEYADEYMRSPEFLQAMKESFRQSIEMRKQMNEYLGRIQHEFQNPNRQDVDHIMASVSRLESRLSTSLKRIEDRLDALASQLETPQGKPASTTSNAAPKTKAGPRKTTTKAPPRRKK